MRLAHRWSVQHFIACLVPHRAHSPAQCHCVYLSFRCDTSWIIFVRKVLSPCSVQVPNMLSLRDGIAQFALHCLCSLCVARVSDVWFSCCARAAFNHGDLFIIHAPRVTQVSYLQCGSVLDVPDHMFICKDSGVESIIFWFVRGNSGCGVLSHFPRHHWQMMWPSVL